MAAVDQASIDMVVEVIGHIDKSLIANALRANHGNVETVIIEWFDDSDKFRRKYAWDESAFASNREGDRPAGSGGPSFVIHPPDNDVIYGTEPGGYYAPSRPPSRANNRSPMSRVVDLTAGDYTTDAPTSRQEEEDHLQRAINESLQTSGMPTPHMMAFPPPPAPHSQQSGITSNNDNPVYFGPANRPDYDPDEWAMVRVKTYGPDPDPALRVRKPGAPVLLRCRDEGWNKHRLGAMLMVYNQIPAARNLLLRCGGPPGYGLGNKSDWWKGETIFPPGMAPDSNGWGAEPSPNWVDELLRILAFMDSTDRSYGTADMLAKAKHPDVDETGDVEKDFIKSVMVAHNAQGTGKDLEVLVASAEVVSFDNLVPQTNEFFGILDLQLGSPINPVAPRSLYEVFDYIFMVNLRYHMDDPSTGRMAWILNPSEVLTLRFTGDESFPSQLEIPDTFYLDRYLKYNGTQFQRLQLDMMTVLKLLDAYFQEEESLVRWINPKTNRAYDRRAILKAAVRRCQERITKIKNKAFWRQHEEGSSTRKEEYYLPDHSGEPQFTEEEAKVVAYYKSKITEFEVELANIESSLNERVVPQKQKLQALLRRMQSSMTEPEPDHNWNPTHKYSLRGVISDPNTVFIRIREPLQPDDLLDDEAAAFTMDRWWKVSYNAEEGVEHNQVSWEVVKREGCGSKPAPMLIYATEKALEQEPLPLPDALKTFVRFDNHLFKQELAQSSHSMDKKRSAMPALNSQSKRLQRSNSMDSMASNRASMGDSDNEMHDAPVFNRGSVFSTGDFAAYQPRSSSINLIDLEDDESTTLVQDPLSPHALPHSLSGDCSNLPPPPPYDSISGGDVEMQGMGYASFPPPPGHSAPPPPFPPPPPPPHPPALDPGLDGLAQVSLASSPPKVSTALDESSPRKTAVDRSVDGVTKESDAVNGRTDPCDTDNTTDEQKAEHNQTPPVAPEQVRFDS